MATLEKTRWTPEALQRISDLFEQRSPEDLLAWGFGTFGDGLVMATGFGPSGVVLMHLVSRIRPDATIFYLDTGLLFEETHALREELAQRLGLTFTRVHTDLSLEQQAAGYGEALWERAPDQCCSLRKVQPLRRFLADKQAWITGIRRDQGITRARTPLVGWDEVNKLVKLNPLANWSSDEVWDYIYLYGLPFNRLHDEGYPSIGCLPCTRPVVQGEDERAGRWAGLSKTECGIHVQPSKTHKHDERTTHLFEQPYC